METKKTRNGGFTLLETLLTVAILIILMALSAVGVARYKDYLDVTELDNAARDIYMAAENRVVLLQNSGAAAATLSTSASSGSSLATVNYGEGSEQKTAVVLSSTESATTLDKLLPEGVIDPALRDGRFYILYDEDTRHVVEVFYAEGAFGLTDENLPTLRADRSTRVSAFRDKSNSIERLVGYYGSAAGDKIGTKPLPTPGVEVFIDNGEELTLKVTYTLPEGLPTGVTVTCTPSVSLTYDGTQKVDDLITGRPPVITGGDLANAASGSQVTYEWVLDSLEKDAGGNYIKQFKDLGLTGLGGDFTVTASLELKADGYIESSYYARDTDNSLFAKQTRDEDTAYIANLRHLQNLCADFSNVRDGITGAKQLNDIDCEKYYKNDGTTVLDGAYKFTPITNGNLTEYDGQNNHITNLTTTTSAAAGLFGTVSNDLKVLNTRVCWTKPENLVQLADKPTDYLYAVSGNSTGGMIGSITGGDVRIENSFAATTVKGTAAAGGLVGSKTGGTLTIQNSYADCYLKAGADANASAAGLVGSGTGNANDTKLQNSYAAGFIVEPGEKVSTAGLVNGSATATKCYSVVRVKKDADGKENLEKPATPLYTGWDEKNPGSAFYLSKPADVTNAVKTAWGGAFEYETGKPETHVYDLRHRLNTANPTLKLTPPYPFPGLADVTETVDGTTETITITFPHYGDWAELEDDKPIVLELVYDESYDGETAGTSQYGVRFSNQFTAENTTEAAKENNPQAYALLNDPKFALTNGNKIVRTDGYALALKTTELDSLKAQQTRIVWSCVDAYTLSWVLKWNQENSKWQWSDRLQSETTQPAETGWKDAGKVIEVGSDSDYTLIPLPVEMVYGDALPVSNSSDLKLNQKLAVKTGTSEERVFYFNPHFFVAIQGPGTDGSAAVKPKDESTEVMIRTPRHFYDLSRTYQASSGSALYYPQTSSEKTFVQALDLDYAEYTGQLDADGTKVNTEKLPFKQDSITDSGSSSGSANRFSYDGQYHRIRNVFVNNTKENTGLFRQLNQDSELKNIVFEMDPEEPQPMGGLGAQAGNAGALLGYSDGGKLTNCAVYGVNITANARYIGGLVGYWSKGDTFQGCSAEIARLDGSGNIGGLVGVLYFGSAKLTESYAVGYISKTSGSEDIGGLVGSMPYRNTVISNCYAAVRLEGGSSRYGLCSYGTVTNSYWLTGTFRYRGKTYTVAQTTYEQDKNGGSKPITPAELAILSPAESTVKNIPEGADYAADYAGKFPYPTSVKGLRAREPDGSLTDYENPATGPIHYGLWPVEIPPEVTLFYYEQYQDNTYGFYRAIRETGKPAVEINTLKNDQTILRDGYALAVKKKDLAWFVSTSTSKSKVSVQYGATGNPKTVVHTFSKVKVNGSDSFTWDGLDENERPGTEPIPLQTVQVGATAAETEEYVMLPLWYSVHTGDRPDNRYLQSLTVKMLWPDGKTEVSSGTRSFYFNPHFAKAMSCPAEGSTATPAYWYPTMGQAEIRGENPVPVYVRTARHFYALSRFEPEYVRRYYYLQECDVDYGSYTGYGLFPANGKVYAQPVIGNRNGPNSNAAFTGTYDGGGHRLKNVVFGGSGLDKRGLGLFGVIGNVNDDGGCLKNMIYEPGGTATVNCNISQIEGLPTSLYVGGLAGSNYKGTIENCAVLGFNANIVFENGVVEEPKKTQIEYFYVGSLVAINQGGIIRSCFAEVRNLTVPSAADANVAPVTEGNVTSFAVGALVGCSYGSDTLGHALVENCYAVGVIKGGSGAKISGLVGQSGHRSNGLCTIKNSYSAVAVKGDADKYNICHPHWKTPGTVEKCYYLSGTWSYGDESYTTEALLDAGVPGYGITAQTYDQLAGLTIENMGKVTGTNVYPFPVSTKGKDDEWYYSGKDWPKK